MMANPFGNLLTSGRRYREKRRAAPFIGRHRKPGTLPRPATGTHPRGGLMTRIRPTTAPQPPVADNDRAGRIAATLAGVWGHRPEAHRAYAAATEALRATGTLQQRMV
jgi:hypothetical protein